MACIPKSVVSLGKHLAKLTLTTACDFIPIARPSFKLSILIHFNAPLAFGHVSLV